VAADGLHTVYTHGGRFMGLGDVLNGVLVPKRLFNGM